MLVAGVTAAVILAGAVSGAAGVAIRAVAGAVSVSALAYGVRRNSATPAVAWLLVTVGLGVWVAADAMSGSLVVAGVAEHSSLFHLTDAIHLAMFPVIFAGIVMLEIARSSGSSLASILDDIILVAAGGLLVWTYLVTPGLAGTASDQLLGAAYPFGDAMLVAGVLWLVLTPGELELSLWLLLGATTLLFAADLAWVIARNVYPMPSSSWLNAVYPVVYALVAAAALHPSVAHLTDKVPEEPDHVHPARLVFLFVALVAASITPVWGGGRNPLIEACTLVLLIAIGLRFFRMVRGADRARRMARVNERRFRVLAAASPVGIYEVAPDMQITFANEESRRLLRGSAEGMTVTEAVELVDPRDRDVFTRAGRALMDGRRTSVEVRMRTLDGEPRWVSVHAAPAHEGAGPFEGAVACTLDISELKQAQSALAVQATHDPLTGLPNRRLLLDRLSSALAGLGERPGTVAVLFLDLDRFKLVNDLLGHDAGDELLEVVGRRVRHAIRADDTAARFGGDEFVVLLERIPSRSAATSVAQTLIASIAEPIVLQGTEMGVTASVGIALSASPGDDPDALLRDADAAMYQAKRAGQAQFRYFDGKRGRAETARIRPGEPHSVGDLRR